MFARGRDARIVTCRWERICSGSCVITGGSTSQAAFSFLAAQADKPWNVTAVRQEFRLAVRIAGIEKACTTHTLRHSYASHCLQAGVKIGTIQQILGHANLETTATYTHVTGGTNGAEEPFPDLLAEDPHEDKRWRAKVALMSNPHLAGHVSTCLRNRRCVSPLWPQLSGQLRSFSRAASTAGAQGTGCLSHVEAGRPRAGVHSVRTPETGLQLLWQSALSEVPGRRAWKVVRGSAARDCCRWSTSTWSSPCQASWAL